MKLQVSSLIPSGEVSRQLDNTAYENILKLLMNLGDITAVAAIADQLGGITGNPAYTISNIFPTTGMAIGDLVVDLMDGGIYEWKIVAPATTPSWVLIAQSAGTSSGTSNAVIPIVDALPVSTTAGSMVFNTPDGLFYAYINGAWQTVVSPPAESATIGIAVYAVNPTTGLYEGLVIFNSTLNQLLKYTGGVWVQVVEPTGAAATVADGSITTAKFATGLRPVEVVDILPTTGNSIGRMAMLTTDGLLYRYTATGWSTAVPTTALTGTITSTQIGANQITTGNLAVGAVTADTIAANAITSDKITANSITTAMIQVGAIGASQIATDAITASKVAAGAITAGKIAALSIDATKIVAGTISADKMAANSITAGSIAAGAVSTNHLAANSVTASQISAGSVTATKIASGSVTADKIDVDALLGKRVQLDSTLAASTYSVTDSIFGTQTTAFSFLNTNRTYGICSVKSNGGGGSAIYGLCSNASQTGAAVVGFQQGTSTSAWAGFFENTTGHGLVATSRGASVGVNGVSNTGIGVLGISNNSYGVEGRTSAALGQWGVLTFQRTYSAQGYFPFTGSHISFGNEEYEIGDIVYAYKTMLTDVNESHVKVKNTTVDKCKEVFGVVSFINHNIDKNLHNNTNLCNPISSKDYINVDLPHQGFKDEYQGYVDSLYNKNYKEIGVNSLGEGGINVCSEGGNIEIGDYICSSNTKGKGMKQDDDLLHNYTVAKALEAVDWAKETETAKMIACTYHCG